MNTNGGEQGGEVDYDKLMAEQSAKMEKMKGLKKKEPLIARDKKAFDSADYFKEKEQKGHEQGASQE